MRIQDVIVPAALLCIASHADTGKKVAVKEVVFDSAVADIQWLGSDQKIVLVQTAKGRLYRSVNSGEKWNDITDQLRTKSSEQGGGESIVIDHITKCPADPSTVLVAGTHRTHFISMNGGETFRRVKQKASIHTFIFHKTRPKWALLSTWTPACEARRGLPSSKDDDETPLNDNEPCNHMLYITKDMGKTFHLVTSYVVQFSWGDVSHEQQDRIYYTHFREKKGDQPKLYVWSQDVDFAYSDDSGRHESKLVHHGNKFMVSHGFIFVAKLQDASKQTVSLMVSSDGGISFRQAKLPTDIEEKSYTVLDTSEGVVMLHVNHGANIGNVYISDRDGVRFTLSLPDNVRSSSGDCEFDKVLSLEGVYLANQQKGAGGATNKQAEVNQEAEELEDAAGSGTSVDQRRGPKGKGKEEVVVRTVISFDKGGVWSYLKAPKVDSLGKKTDCPPERCWLHLHGVTNFHNYAPFYSTENAVGIIMGTGNTGPYLRFEPDQTNTYLSRDGGLTWVEAHKGAFIYEFGDHGGLLVMADDIRKTKQVVFSWNEGKSWYDFELSDYPMMVDNVVIEPNATSTKFLLYGTRGDSGAMYHLDFEALGQPLCKGVWAVDSVSSDYESWSPSDGRGQDNACLLGHQQTYTRRKQTSECFNGEKFERPVTRANCPCTQEDFECEMGFTRQLDSLDCKFANDDTIPIPAKCSSSDVFHADGYRKVVADTCEGGWVPQKVAVPCPDKKLSKGAMSVLGSLSMVIVLMIAVNYLSRSDKFKGMFANYGMDSFGTVKYSTIGGKNVETALESVGTRFDSDFMEADQDDFSGDAPQLMAFNDRGQRSRDHDRPRSRELPRGVDTAAASVPKLAKPPGAGGGDDEDSLDLL